MSVYIGWAVATFAGGCFWGVELAFQRVPGVMDTSVGYTQGHEEKPIYEDVCSGGSGHTEAVQVFYDPAVVSFEELLNVLWSRINPTTLNRQGNDVGPQYRSGIYPHTENQFEVAMRSVKKEQEKHRSPIVTEVKPAKIYWPAEDYHQHYLAKGGRFGAGQSVEKNCTDPIRCYG
jgi:peptide-methionine (S)-S-oxide reductase